MMKLVEEVSGVGDLSAAGDVIRQVRYQIARYQGMHDVSGLPIPGLHRIEGSVDAGGSFDFAPFVGAALIRHPARQHSAAPGRSRCWGPRRCARAMASRRALRRPPRGSVHPD